MKSILPRGLLARALLILALPVVLAQSFAAYMFYGRHWENVHRHMSEALAGEVELLVRQARMLDPEARARWLEEAGGTLHLELRLEPGSDNRDIDLPHPYPVFERKLSARLGQDVAVFSRDEDRIVVRVPIGQDVLMIHASKKRLDSPTTYIFIFWMVGVSALLLGIALLFLRNQVRPVIQLAEAAERFGKGLDVPSPKLRGASEIRIAASAFRQMKERLQRVLQRRTEMLAAISHDLRTPLTRMKLQLALLEGHEAAPELQADIAEMEHMIQEYLDFVRGEGGEEAAPTDLSLLLEALVESFIRPAKARGIALEAAVAPEMRIELQPQAFRRAIGNVLDNGLHYAKSRLNLSAACEGEKIIIRLEDDGPGIPEAKREEVFRPFHRLDSARSRHTGGAGLGLSIARDIILARGGAIRLDRSAALGGLKVEIVLPV